MAAVKITTSRWVWLGKKQFLKFQSFLLFFSRGCTVKAANSRRCCRKTKLVEYSASTKWKKNRWISQNLLVICLKCISEERLLFNGNEKIINASVKFLIKVPIQKAKLLQKSSQKSDTPNQFQKISNQRSDTASILSSLNYYLPYFFFLHSFLFTWNIF